MSSLACQAVRINCSSQSKNNTLSNNRLSAESYHSRQTHSKNLPKQTNFKTLLTCQCWTTADGQFVIMQCFSGTSVLLQQQSTETQIQKKRNHEQQQQLHSICITVLNSQKFEATVDKNYNVKRT